jgi:hypothetical protein
MKAKNKKQIGQWLEFARENKKSHILIVHDTYKDAIIVVYVSHNQKIEQVVEDYMNISKVKVLEVYNTNLEPTIQLDSEKNWEI